MISIPEVVKLFEKLPAIAVSGGLALLLVGLSIDLGVKYELINKDLLAGTIGDYARVGWIIGAALIAGALLNAFVKRLAKMPDWIDSLRSKRQSKQQLDQNLLLLDLDEMILLYAIFQKPYGRVYKLKPIPPAQKLYDLGIIQATDGTGYFGSFPDGVVMIAPYVFRQKSRLMPEIEEQVIQRTKMDIGTDDGLARLIEMRKGDWDRELARSWMKY